jgi:hypothetical protein
MAACNDRIRTVGDPTGSAIEVADVVARLVKCKNRNETNIGRRDKKNIMENEFVFGG